MRIDDTTWTDIIAATEASIAKWNQAAADKGRPDKFRMHVETGGSTHILITEHRTPHNVVRKAVGRDIETGNLRKVRVKKVGKGLGASIQAAPKSWNRLAGKSGSQIVKGLKLSDFCMLLGASHISDNETEAA